LRAQLDVHINAALNVGVTPPQIIEAFLHSAVYCGFPRARNATLTAKKLFVERGLFPITRRDLNAHATPAGRRQGGNVGAARPAP
jgi:hypothetical protein